MSFTCASFPHFYFLSKRSRYEQIQLFFFFGNLNNPDGCYAPLLSYRKARLPSTWNKSGQICGSRAACSYSASAGGGLSCTAAVLLQRGGEIWGCVCSCSVKPSELCWGWGGGKWLWVLSCASQGSSRSSNECIQGSNHHD